MALFMGKAFSQFLPPSDHYIDLVNRKVSRGISSYSKNEYSQSKSFARNYILALQFKEDAPDKACPILKNLSETLNFPLHNYIQIKILESCVLTRKEMVSWLSSYSSKVPFWANETYLKIAYRKAKQFKLNEFMVIHSLKISRHKKLQKDKISFLKGSLNLAIRIKDFKSAKSIKKRIEYLAPRLIKRPRKKDYYSIGYDYEKNRDFFKARKFYRKIINGRFKFRSKIKAWNRLRLSFKKERKKDLYIKMTKRMGRFIKKRIKKAPKNKAYLTALGENQINLARAIWTNHQRVKAKKILLNLKKYSLLENNIKAQIEWLLGNMVLETKNLKLALKHFEKGSQFETDNNEIKERLNWSLGWNQYILKNYEDANITFRDFSNKTENFYLKIKLKFWRAQSLLKLKRKREANKVFREIMEDDLYGYYGVLSHKILKKPFTPIKFKNESTPSTYPVFSWLLSLGEIDDAKEYLDHLSSKIKKPEEVKGFLKLYSKAQYFQKGIGLFHRLAPDKRQAILHDKLELIYPNPFDEEVREASKRFKISSPLIYSITRQESAFDPHARSWADAFGLMQLTPETAKVLAKKYNIIINSPTDLYHPKKNIFLGSSLLKDLKKKFNNQFILYVASYNASHKVVKRWKKDRFNGNHIEFIEMIPYEETMNYVKLVLRNFFIYKRLLSQENFYFPKTFFTSGQS